MSTLRLVSSFLVVAPFAVVFSACGGSTTEGPATDVDTGTGSDVSLVESGGDTSKSDTTAGDTGTPPPGDAGIKCGTETCDAAAQECCAGTAGLKCVAKGGCGGGTVIPCSDPSSCKTGETCCAVREGFGLKVSCSATCAGLALCTSDTDCTSPEKCAAGVLGYKYCSGRDGGTGFDASGFDTSFLDTGKGG